MRFITVLLLSVSLANATRIAGDTHKTIVQRNGYVIAAFTDDGWVCYGTHGDVHCHSTMQRNYPQNTTSDNLAYYIHEIEKELQ